MSTATFLKRLGGRLVVCLVLLALGAGTVWHLNLRGEVDPETVPDTDAEAASSAPATPAQVSRGAYLARAGNCAACHTARGGAPYAGGRGIATPFGTVYTSNLTPDAATGLGTWSSAHFWRAMHHGRSKDGRLLYPAFPYPNYTQVTREDADAIWAYLRSLPAVSQSHRDHDLRFPFNRPWALAVWRALFFKPGVYQPVAAQSADWNRGAYLVRGLGHCNACHASRNLLGATSETVELSGGLIPVQNWYAPSLSDPHEAGVADWPRQQVVALLKTGVSPTASVMGPMAEVVFSSTQHLSEPDLTAMATFLQALAPPANVSKRPSADRASPAWMGKGSKLYEQHCAACHGASGQGSPGIYPALAGNRAVTMDSTVNLVRVVLSGGYLPSTQGNPRPFGMPPFTQTLNEAEIAAVLTFIRGSWGNQASPVTAVAVLNQR